MSEDRGMNEVALEVPIADMPLSMPRAAPLTAPVGSEPLAGDIARQLRRLETATEILRGWIWETDAEHRFTYLSDSVARFAGRPPEWHYGKTRQDLGNLNPSNAEHQHYIRQLETKSMFGPIEFVRYQNGVQLWMRTVGMPQFDAEGRFTGYCGLAFDVSDEVEARQGNRRVEPRKRIARSATISQAGAPAPVPCIVLDISSSGARLDVHETAEVPRLFRLMMDLEGVERTCHVVWRTGNSLGVRFVEER